MENAETELKNQNTGEESTDSEHDQSNALFVCSVCGEICIILTENWTNSIKLQKEAPTSPKFRRPAEFLSYNKTFIIKKDQSNWIHKDKLQEFKDEFKRASYIKFPLCNSCAQNIITKIKKELAFLNFAESLFLRLDITDKFIFANNLKAEIDNIIIEKNAFAEAKTEYEKETNRLKTQGAKRRNSAFLLKGYTEHQTESKIETPKTAGPPLTFSSLTFCMVFHISYNRFYGTINQMRLGQNIARDVPYEEINDGFMMLFQLIGAMCRIGNIECSILSLSVPLSIDGSVLNAYDTSYRRGAAVFNTALKKLFAFCADLFMNSIVCSHSLTPPFVINTDDSTISQESFLFDFKNPDGWTRAMKLLLFDFKFIQMKMMKGTKFIPNV